MEFCQSALKFTTNRPTDCMARAKDHEGQQLKLLSNDELSLEIRGAELPKEKLPMFLMGFLFFVVNGYIRRR